jgi:polyferredoxin
MVYARKRRKGADMDQETIEQRTLLFLAFGALSVVIGIVTVWSQIDAWSPSAGVILTGYILTGLGGMLLQASLIGFLIAFKTKDRSGV